jgi:hypothetical protein
MVALSGWQVAAAGVNKSGCLTFFPISSKKKFLG